MMATIKEDCLNKLRSIRDQNEGRLIIGRRTYSVAELINEVTEETELGKELLRLHAELIKLINMPTIQP